MLPPVSLPLQTRNTFILSTRFTFRSLYACKDLNPAINPVQFCLQIVLFSTHHAFRSLQGAYIGLVSFVRFFLSIRLPPPLFFVASHVIPRAYELMFGEILVCQGLFSFSFQLLSLHALLLLFSFRISNVFVFQYVEHCS